MHIIYTIILSVFAKCRSQFLLDCLERCVKLFVSTESISCHVLASQVGLNIFLHAKNTQHYHEYIDVILNWHQVYSIGGATHTYATVYLIEAPNGHCSPITVDRSPATMFISGENGDHIGPCRPAASD